MGQPIVIGPAPEAAAPPTGPPAAPPKPAETETSVTAPSADGTLFIGSAVEPGAKGAVVTALQQLLADAGFYRGVIDGSYGPRTRAAVVALHKALGVPRTDVWQAGDWEMIRGYRGPVLPPRRNQPDRVEIDLTRQLLYLIKQDRLAAIIPVSTGNGKPYHSAVLDRQFKARTPIGSFVFHWHHDGWKTSYLGKMYRPWYFRGGYALHGSGNVPPEPASHGCARVPLWEADYLSRQLALGMPIHLWRKP